LRDRYVAAVAAAANPRTDANVQATGLRLARAQRSAVQALQDLRRTSARAGASINPRTNNPTTSADFLGLILQEQRAQTNSAVAAANALASVSCFA
jgi:hypothetical protein